MEGGCRARREADYPGAAMGFNRARDPWQPSSVFRYAFDLAGSPTHPKLCFLTTGTGDRKASPELTQYCTELGIA
jgi:hypothetical protein